MKTEKNMSGRNYWRSLGGKVSPRIEDRDPAPDSCGHDGDNSWSRRNFLALTGASLAMAGLASCRRPKEKIVPYVQAPEEIVLGRPKQYATTMPFGNRAYGMLVTCHEGRPTKIEGNPLHPSSQGATNAFMQAALLDLYDPDRAGGVMHNGVKKTYADFVSYWKTLEEKFLANGGEGLAVLAEPFASPTLSRLKREFERRFPNATWTTWEPISDENVVAGMKLAYGEEKRPVYHLDRSKVILSLDSDFLMSEGDDVAAVGGFAAGRRMTSEADEMNRLYVIESRFSVTGAAADHRLRVKPSEVAPLALALARELKKNGLKLDGVPGSHSASRHEFWLSAVARDLLANVGGCLILAGHQQPPEVHALVSILNSALMGFNSTFFLTSLVDRTSSSKAALKDLVSAVSMGHVDSLLVLGGNPAYEAPTDLEFSIALRLIANTVHSSLHRDETSRLCAWHLPMAHFLECWSDARACDEDETYSVVQPMIEPLHGGKSVVEVLNLLATGNDEPGHNAIRATWSRMLPADSEKEWRRTLHDGVGPAERSSYSGMVRRGAMTSVVGSTAFDLTSETGNELAVIFAPDHSTHDGRFANNGWLQEMPDPITKLSWDNAALVSPATARKHDLHSGDIVELTLNGRSIEIPVWIVPGQADDTVVLPLGYGRRNVGRIAAGVGVNTYALRTGDAMYFAAGAAMTGTGRRRDDMANTQDHSSMEGRPIIREATLDEYRRHPEFAREMVEHPPLVSLWNEHDYSKGYQWGMAIDLNACIGCNACAVACQAENNVPIVGREQVHKGREMHWLRIDRYFEGDESNPRMLFQPVACQHCENAPCEQVCPVAATAHDKEGLNMMVYNRCIGTRYCSNNCPYKVRRFNFFSFTGDLAETVKMAQNPDVTVRSRGVMEKCTYCLQRINRARRDAKLADATIKDGDVVTACQQACPTGAIAFGNVNDPDSEVSRVKKRNRSYELLAELNVKPRTSFLARLRNPNPELEES